MAKSKTKHCVIRNEKMFCTHCGGEQVIPFPIGIEMFGAMAKAFDKIHKNCDAIWKPPVADPNFSERERALWWMYNGEHGKSSKAIFTIMTQHEGWGIPENMRESVSHPYDAGDFGRCYGLLQTVPEWRAKLHLMKAVSPVWSNLVDNWDKLTELYEAIAVTFQETYKSEYDNMCKEFSELMEKCGC